jgi:hypothetical protein
LDFHPKYPTRTIRKQAKSTPPRKQFCRALDVFPDRVISEQQSIYCKNKSSKKKRHLFDDYLTTGIISGA